MFYEINIMIYFGLINIDDVLEIIHEKPYNVELIPTGVYEHLRVVRMVTNLIYR